MTGRRQTRRPLLAVWVLIVLYCLYFGALSIAKHEAFQTHAADLGNMDQPIWNTLHGRFVEETKDDGTQGTRLTDHVEPIFAVVSLTYLLYDGVESILVIQTIALAVGALPVYWLARRRLRSGAAAVAFAAVYLLLPALQAANLTEFHAVTLAVAPLLFAFHFFETEQMGWGWLAALLALSVKEEIALLILMLGLYLLIFRKAKAHGALLAVISLAWFAVSTFVIVPHFSEAGRSVYVGRYGSLGGTFGGVLRTLVTQPGTLLALATPDRLAYVAGLLAGTGFLAVLSPILLLLSGPVLAANVLSDYFAMYSGEFHYSAPVMPFVVIAAIYGAGRVADWAGRDGWNRRRVVAALAIWALIWAFGYNVSRGFLPWSRQFDWPQVAPHNRLLSRFAAQIPPESILSTTPPLFPHLSHRRVIYLFPVVNDAEYVLIDVSGTTDMHPNDVRDTYRELTSASRGGTDRFGIVDAADGYVLLRRGHQGPTELPDAFYDFARTTDPQPEYATQVDFGDSLQLRGFDVLDRSKWKLTSVRLYLEVLKPVPAGARPYPFFQDDSGQVIEDTSQRPMIAPLWYAPEKWKPGEIVAVETLPWDLGQTFTLGFGVVRGSDWSAVSQRLSAEIVDSPYVIRALDGWTWVRLLRFERRGERLHYTPEVPGVPPVKMERPLNAGLSGGMACLGADVTMDAERLTVTLYWQADRPIDRDYTVFVHLTDENGHMVAQNDAPPCGGAMPTSTWLAGETVTDQHSLPLPPALPAGDYHLNVGLYAPDTMQRVPVVDGNGKELSDHIDLGTVTGEK